MTLTLTLYTYMCGQYVMYVIYDIKYHNWKYPLAYTGTSTIYGKKHMIGYMHDESLTRYSTKNTLSWCMLQTRESPTKRNKQWFLTLRLNTIHRSWWRLSATMIDCVNYFNYRNTILKHVSPSNDLIWANIIARPLHRTKWCHYRDIISERNK